jgi:mannitol/fructose-specific phosphotransferase system IIA component (Ntr-type)
MWQFWTCKHRVEKYLACMEQEKFAHPHYILISLLHKLLILPLFLSSYQLYKNLLHKGSHVAMIKLLNSKSDDRNHQMDMVYKMSRKFALVR